MHRMIEKIELKHPESIKYLKEYDPKFIKMISDVIIQDGIYLSVLENAINISNDELEQKNSELNAIFKAIPDIFFQIDLNGIIFTCNGENKKDLILEEHELLGKNIINIPEKHVSQRFKDAIEIVNITGETTDFNYYWVFSKERRYYKCQIIKLNETSLLVSIKNISELQQVIFKLQDSEEELKGFLRALPDSILTTNINGKLISIISSTSPRDVRPYVLPPSEKRTEIISNTVDSHESQVYEYEVVIRKKKYWVEARTAIIRHKLKKDLDIIWLLRNVTKRKRAYEQTEQLLSSISSILIGVDENDIVNRWNESAEETFLILAEDALGTNFIDLNINWNWQKTLLRIGEARSKKIYSHLEDIEFTDIEKNEKLFSITVNPIIENNLSKGYLLLISDTTQSRTIEMQLRQAQKLEAIGQLAAGVAHEINTPLQYINDNTFFLKDSIKDLFKMIKQISRLVENSSLEEHFVNSLKTFKEECDYDYLADEIPNAVDSALNGISKVIEIVKSLKKFSHMDTDDKVLVDINDCLKNTVIVSKSEWKYVAELKEDYDNDLNPIMGLHGELSQVF